MTVKVYTIQNTAGYAGGRWFVPADHLKEVKAAMKKVGHSLGEVKGPFSIDEDFLSQCTSKIEIGYQIWDDTWWI